jgi:tetratricopeptide (TPR) repeat protein
MRKTLVALAFIFLFSGCASNKAQILYRSAYDLYQRNELEKSETVISQIIYRDSKFVDAYILRSVINQTNKKPDLAIGDLQIAIAIDKGNYLAHYNLGNLYFKQEKYGEALEQFSASLSSKKDFPNAYLNRANTYMMLRDHVKALDDYRIFNSLSRDQDESVKKMIAMLEKKIAS